MEARGAPPKLVPRAEYNGANLTILTWQEVMKTWKLGELQRDRSLALSMVVASSRESSGSVMVPTISGDHSASTSPASNAASAAAKLQT